MKRRWTRFIRPDLIAVLLGLLAWEIYGRLDDGKRLTPFTDVVSTAWTMFGEGEFNDIFSTMLLFGAAFLASLALALVTTALMSMSKVIRTQARPYLYAFLAIPPLALVPVFTLLWGPSDLARVVAVFFFAYFPMAVIFVEAVEDSPEAEMEVATSFGASKLKLFLHIQLPSVTERLIAGARIGAVRGLKGAVTAEVVMGGVGLGGLLRTYSAGFQLPQLYATVFVIVLVSVVLYVALQALESYLQRRMG